MWSRGLIFALWHTTEGRTGPPTATSSLSPHDPSLVPPIFAAPPTLCTDYGIGGVVSSACSSDTLSLAYDNFDVTLFLSLYEITGLDALLRCPGPTTLLLPTNDAVIGLGESRLRDLLDPSNKDELLSLLLYHILPTTSLQNGLISTLTNGTSVYYQEGSSSFDGSMPSVDNFETACNGLFIPIQRVLNPLTNTNRPSTLPSISPSVKPSALPSLAPSVSPSSSQFFVETEPFVISYRSQNASEPAGESFRRLNDDVVAYYSILFAALFNSSQAFDFVSLHFEIDFTLHGDDALPGFNIFVQYQPAIFEFTRKPGVAAAPEESDLFQEMQNGITVDFLLDVVRTQVNTAFAEVISARMTLVPAEERLRPFFIAYNTENSTMPSEATFQRLARENEAYFNAYFREVYGNDDAIDFLGVDLILKSTMHGSDPNLPVGFNVGLQYSNTIFFFSPKANIPSDLELFALLQDAITIEYLLEVRRIFSGTAFGDVIEGLLE